MRKPRKPVSVNQIVRRHSSLAQLATQAQTLLRVQRRLDAALPSLLAGHWQLAHSDQKLIALVAESPTWATRLRFHESALRDALSAQGLPAGGRVRISVARHTADSLREETGSETQLPEIAMQSLEQAANRAGNGPLGDALRTMLSRHRQRESRGAATPRGNDQGTADTGTD